MIGPRRDLLQHRTLVRRRVFENSVRNDDRRDSQAVDDVDHFVTVGTAVDAVLVLDDGDVALVEQLGACRYRCRRAVDQFTDDTSARSSATRRRSARR